MNLKTYTKGIVILQISPFLHAIIYSRGDISLGASENITELLPDWYLIERGTEKTIEKLNSVKELNYYICNTDEYIRRLAILRLKKLGLKESGGILKEILDDPVESYTNKQIAAWALKSLLVESGTDYMMSSRFLANFTGREKYEELFIVVTGQEAGSVNFQFSSSPYYSAFRIDDENSVLEKDIFFEADFDMKKWLKDLGTGVKANAKKLLPGIFSLIKASVLQLLKLLKSTSAFISKLKSEKKAATSEESNLNIKTKVSKKQKFKDSSNVLAEQTSYDNTPADIFSRRSYISTAEMQAAKMYRQMDSLYDYGRIRKDLYERPGFLACAKKGVFQVFYIMFYPLRFVLKHKLAVFCLLLCIYSFFAYFSYGRAITNKYAGFDIQEVQSKFFRKAETFYYQARSEINRVTGIDEWIAKSKTKQVSGDILQTSNTTLSKDQSGMEEGIEFYRVTAKDGLNIRKDPDASSKKVGSKALPYGSTVALISSASSESSGVEWLYVKAEDGRVGWVSSKYLRKDEGE